MAKKTIFYSVAEVAKLEKRPYHKVIRLLKKGHYKDAEKIGWGWIIPTTSVKKAKTK